MYFLLLYFLLSVHCVSYFSVSFTIYLPLSLKAWADSGSVLEADDQDLLGSSLFCSLRSHLCSSALSKWPVDSALGMLQLFTASCAPFLCLHCNLLTQDLPWATASLGSLGVDLPHLVFCCISRIIGLTSLKPFVKINSEVMACKNTRFSVVVGSYPPETDFCLVVRENLWGPSSDPWQTTALQRDVLSCSHKTCQSKNAAQWLSNKRLLD